MEKERNVAVTVTIITGVFGVIVALINIIPSLVRNSGDIVQDIAVNARPVQQDPPGPGHEERPVVENREGNKVPPQNHEKNEVGQMTRDVVSLFARECKSSTQVSIGKITCRDSELVGPVAFEIRSSLARAISEHHAFEFVGEKVRQAQITRGVKLIGAHRIEVNYFDQQGKAFADFFFKAPDGAILKKQRIELPASCLSGFLPSNEKQIGATLKKMSVKKITVAPQGLFSLHLSTDRGDQGAVYRHGEQLKIEVVVSRDCYLHLYYLQADGSIVRIFPNDFHADNFIKAGLIYTIPSVGYPFKLEIDCEICQGIEAIKAIASLDPLPDLKGENVGHGLRGIKIEADKLMADYRKSGQTVEAMCTLLTQR